MADQQEVQVVSVKIPKAAASISVDLAKLPNDVWNEVVQKGLQSILTRGMSKITTTGLEDDDLAEAREAALAKANENLNDAYEGKIRLMATKRTKTKGKERTEALRMAKQIVKDQMKAEGLKVSHYSAKEITLAAEQVLEDNPELLEQAKQILAEREEKAKGFKKIELKKTMKADPKKVKATEEQAAKRKAKRKAGNGDEARA